MNYFKDILIDQVEAHKTSSALICENAQNHLIFKKEVNIF